MVKSSPGWPHPRSSPRVPDGRTPPPGGTMALLVTTGGSQEVTRHGVQQRGVFLNLNAGLEVAGQPSHDPPGAGVDPPEVASSQLATSLGEAHLPRLSRGPTGVREAFQDAPVTHFIVADRHEDIVERGWRGRVGCVGICPEVHRRHGGKLRLGLEPLPVGRDELVVGVVCLFLNQLGQMVGLRCRLGGQLVRKGRCGDQGHGAAPAPGSASRAAWSGKNKTRPCAC